MTDHILELILAQLQGRASRAQKKELEDWLVVEDNRLEYERIKTLWQNSADVAHLNEVNQQRDWESLRHRLYPAKKNLWWRWAAAASIVLVMGFGALWYLNQSRAIVEYAAQSNTAQYTLNDGSEVFLNRNSRLLVDRHFGEEARNVTLIGEGFFEVASDPTRPFIVTTGNTKTQVLGTAFNIREDHTISIQVDHGRVAFSTDQNSIELTQNMAATVATNGTVVKQKADLNAYSWKTGILQFENDLLSKVFRDLEKQYDISISTEGISENLQLTSTYEKQQPTAILDEICLIHNLQYEAEGNRYTITNK
mgnify:CR=1 FL=1